MIEPVNNNIEQNQIDYADLMNLGFERYELSDSIYENMHGHKAIYVYKNVTKNIRVEWDQDTRFCKLVRYKKDKSNNHSEIRSVMLISDFDQLVSYINFFLS